METNIKDGKLDVEPEKKKRFKRLIRGFVTLLPIVLFVVILVWLWSVIKYSVSWIGDLIIGYIDYEIPVWVVHVVSFFVLLFLIWFVGFLMDENILGDKLRNLFRPIIKRIPVLNYLFKVTNQVFDTLTKTNSLKETVILKCGPLNLVGFITSRHPKSLEKDLNNPNLVSVFFPTTPNPTNGILAAVDEKDLMPSEMNIPDGVSFVISMGTAVESNFEKEDIGETP